MSKASPKPQRGRRSMNRVPIEETTRDVRLTQRMYHERIAELSLLLVIIAGIITIATAPLLLSDNSWGLPVFGSAALLCGLGILIYLRTMVKVNIIDRIEEEEHHEWASVIKETVKMDWEDEESEAERSAKPVSERARALSELSEIA